MTKLKSRSLHLALFLICIFSTKMVFAQRTQIKGFVAVNAYLEGDKVNFGIGEQDLFITSELNDDFSFLGETVFKYSPNSPTKFNVSVERIIITYNFSGNHNLYIGKHHTPINYWNDTYHHGRVFFPTIMRPLLFNAYSLPIHTTGVGVKGYNLGKLKFGYNVLIGNGIGSGEIADNDKYKSVTAAIQIKPTNDLQLGLSFYHDVISEGAEGHNGEIFTEKIKQQLYTGTIAYFGNKFELLAEGTCALNHANSTGNVPSYNTYAYARFRVTEKIVPYIRFDYLTYKDDEIYFEKDNTTSILGGLRYEINYLIVFKAEYQHLNSEVGGIRNILNTQIAIGF